MDTGNYLKQGDSGLQRPVRQPDHRGVGRVDYKYILDRYSSTAAPQGLEAGSSESRVTRGDYRPVSSNIVQYSRFMTKYGKNPTKYGPD